MKVRRYVLFFWPVLLWLIWTWPLVFNFSTSIYSDYLGDSTGWMTPYRSPAFLQPHDFLAPFYGGVPWLLSQVTDAVVVYNLMVFFSWLGTFWGGWWLLRTLKLSRGVAFFGATAFLLAPIRIWHSFEWPNHAQWGFMLVYLGCLVQLVREFWEGNGGDWGGVKRGLLKRAFWAGLLLGLLFVENLYHGFMVFWLTAGAVIFTFGWVCFKGRKRDEPLGRGIFPPKTGQKIGPLLTPLSGAGRARSDLKPFLKVGLVFGLSALVFSLPVLGSFWTSPVGSGMPRAKEATRGFDDRMAFSARPWHYLIPDINHPLWGNWALEAHRWIWSKPPYFLTEPFFPKEDTLYLGVTLLGLGGYGVLRVFLGDRGDKGKRGDSKGFYFKMFAFLAVVMFIFSLPPLMTLRGVKFYFPSHFLYRFFPQVRAYARFGVLVFICTTVVACFGLKELLEKAGRGSRSAVLAGVLGLMVLEFINFPPLHNFSVEPSEAYQWLAEQEGVVIYAEFPVRRDFTDVFFQPLHGKTVWNASRPLPGESKRSIPNYRRPEFPDFLREQEIRYIFLHRQQEKSEKQRARESWGYPIWGNQFGKTPEGAAAEAEAWFIENSNFEVVSDFGDIVVFEVH